MKQMSKSKFKPKALELMRQVEQTGESLIISDHGKPTLELRVYQEQSIDPLARLKGSVVEYYKPTEPLSENVNESDWELA